LVPAVRHAVIEIDFLARVDHEIEKVCASEAGSGGFGPSVARRTSL
jgi:hypothetical protein